MTTPLRGREVEMAMLSGLLRAAHDGGAGAVLLIDGDAGHGKSRLLLEFAAAARATGVNVHAGIADPFAHLTPLGPLAQALTSQPDPLLRPGDLARFAAESSNRYWMLEELQERLEQAAQRRPSLIMIDDAQWCDSLTLLALRSIVPRLTTYPIVWVLARRPHEAGPELTMTWTRLIDSGAQQLALAKMAASDVALIAQDILLAPPSETLVGQLVDLAPNLFLLTEFLTGSRDGDTVTLADGRANLTGSDVSSRLNAAVHRRIGELGEPGRTVINAASALGRAVPMSLLVGLLDMPFDVVLRSVADAESAGLVVCTDEVVTFAHDLIREALVADLPRGAVRALRQRAAYILLDGGGGVAAAELIRLSAEVGDYRASDVLRSAALRAAPTSPRDAAELSAQAVDLSPRDRPEFSQLLREAIQLNWAAGAVGQAHRLADEALRIAAGSDGESALRLEIAMLSTRHSFTEAARQCRSAARIAAADDPIRARIYAFLGLSLLNCGRIDEASTEIARALEEADLAADTPARSLAVACTSTLAWYELDLERALQLSEQSVAIADTDPAGRTLWVPEIWQVMVLSSMGRDSEALRTVDDGLSAARVARQANLIFYWITLRSRVLLDIGRLSDARADAEASLAMAEELDAGDWTKATALYTLVRTALHISTDPLDPTLMSWVQSMARDDAPLLRRAGQWLAALDNYRQGKAHAALRLAADGFVSIDRFEPALATPHDSVDDVTAVRIALAADRRDMAQTIADASHHRTSSNPTFPLLRTVAQHTRALIAGDIDELLRVADGYRSAGRRLAEAAALEDAGRALTARGDLASAQPQFEAAQALYASLAAAADDLRVTRLIQKLGHDVESAPAPTPSIPKTSPASNRWQYVTPSERRVVVLAADGLTNRQIAAELAISPHTVDSHLRHVFNRLAIRSRVELARIVATDPLPDVTPAVGTRGAV